MSRSCASRRKLAGLDLREVENVVDDREQRVRRALDRRREAALARIELRIEQQLGHAEHAVHRRADLVRHAREELALRLARRFGGAAGFDAVVHRLAQRAVGLGQALGALDHLAFQALLLACKLLLAGFDLAEHDVVTTHERADLVIRGDVGALGIIAAFGGLHGVHEVEQRRGDLPLHAPRQ
jgi:hypothetical protein